MEENIKKQEQKIEEKKAEAKKEMTEFVSSSKNFLRELLDIRHDTDKDKTIQSVKDNIAVKGHTAWILVFSILIASIGLNVSSTAVVIGAMLISPLMGPILGFGLSIGINDIDTLRRSIVNLLVMIGLSLLTSFAFFSIPLFQELTPELFARTQPNVLDVMIAISGGLALIVAISRPSAQTNTVAGVAIATALMPPLCTAGYGLAVHDLNYFLGAMFLFLINTTFIALATFVIVKYLRFPMVKYMNSSRRRWTARFASFFAIIVLAASVYTFYNLFLEKKFHEEAKTYIEENIKGDGYALIDENVKDINFEKNSIDITIYGKSVTNKKKKEWEDKLHAIKNLSYTTLNILGGKDDSLMVNEFQNLKDKYVENINIIKQRDVSIFKKDERIEELEKELQKQFDAKIPFLQISEEAKINYEELEEISFSKRLKTNFQKVDTITVFEVKWYDTIPFETKNLKEIKFYKWLKTRLELDTLELKRQ
jgi:uncharacterized hydrophobic protein (TIGR00271 family)